MVEVKLGAATATRIEESYEPNFEAPQFFVDWNSFACLDQDNARKSRRAAIEHCAGSGALLMPCHFGAPFTCHIDHKGAGFAPRFNGNF